MEPRSFAEITSMPRGRRVPFISEGLSLIGRNVATLVAEARFCWPEAPRAASIAVSVAGEEAAKGMMLVDYLRRPRGVDDACLVKHLKSVRSHVARGAYVESYEGRPADFAEMRRYVELVRAPYYLDGPSGYDWIFRNSIEASREDLLYVDVVKTDTGPEWRPAGTTVDLIGSVASFRRHDPQIPRICTVLLDLDAAGLLQPDALEILRSLWSGVELHDATRWTQYDALNRDFVDQARGSRLVADERPLERIVDGLLFPLCGIAVDGYSPPDRKKHREDLEQRQANAAGLW